MDAFRIVYSIFEILQQILKMYDKILNMTFFLKLDLFNSD
jgi:hypothetical protein